VRLGKRLVVEGLRGMKRPSRQRRGALGGSNLGPPMQARGDPTRRVVDLPPLTVQINM
jgi:hypothetical protein